MSLLVNADGTPIESSTPVEKTRVPQELQPYLDHNLLTRKISGDFDLYCYSKSCFYDMSWDKITMEHRGKLYYKGDPVNKPFTKIFNLDEHPSTSYDRVAKLMQNVPYDVYDKANGHLLIITSFVDMDGVLRHFISTKGGVIGPDNDLLNDDVKVIENLGIMDKLVVLQSNVEGLLHSTLMFEIIAEHDMHTMYNNQCSMYDIEGNGLVLLGGYTYEKSKTTEVYDHVQITHENIIAISEYINCSPVIKYDHVEGDIKSWFDHKDIEGYVIHFPSIDLRVKIKTKEYWAIRFTKDLKPDIITSKFFSGGVDRINAKVPEEINVQVIDIMINGLLDWYLDWVNVDALEHYLDASIDMKDLFEDPNLRIEQKQCISNIIRHGGVDGLELSKSVNIRKNYKQFLDENETARNAIETSILEIVEATFTYETD